MKYMNILIVDDSATSRMIIKRCFQIVGYENSKYYEAEDGLQAISLLQDKKVDLILSDLKMPKMDGTTFIKKLNINRNTRGIPIVVISSIGNDTVEKQLLKEGVFGVIHKPISPEKIVETLGEVG